MTRSIQAQNSHTAARLARLRILVGAFLEREMMRGDIAHLLQVGLSAVRSYVKDLRHMIKIVRYVDPSTYSPGEPVYRLAVTVDEAAAYLASLGGAPAALPIQPVRSEMSKAMRDPGRHFHILADDSPLQVRVSRATPARDPYVAALFGPAPAQIGAHA